MSAYTPYMIYNIVTPGGARPPLCKYWRGQWPPWPPPFLLHCTLPTEVIGWMVILSLLVIAPSGPVQTNISRSACTGIVVVAIQLILRLSPTVVPIMGLGGDMVTTGGSGSV